jgi:hypothetical protein
VLVVTRRRIVDLCGDGAALLLGQLLDVGGVEVLVVALADVDVGVGIRVGDGGRYDRVLGEYLKGSHRHK